VTVNHETQRLLAAWRSADRAATAAKTAADAARHAAAASDEARQAAERFADAAHKALVENATVSDLADDELRDAIEQAAASRTARDKADVASIAADAVADQAREDYHKREDVVREGRKD
jgi:hypothetical protein